MEVNMGTAKLFKNGNSQAVRLPKDCRFQGVKEVNATRIGDSVILYPKGDPWKTMWDSLTLFSEDFLSERTQSPVQKREDL